MRPGIRRRTAPPSPALAIPTRTGTRYIALAGAVALSEARVWEPDRHHVAGIQLGVYLGQPLELIAPVGYLDDLNTATAIGAGNLTIEHFVSGRHGSTP